MIEIRGDQTLEQLHHAIFKAYDRWDEHLYEFQFGNVRSIPTDPNTGVPMRAETKKRDGDARTTKLDDLDLKPDRAFGYWFDFGDDWFHQVQVDGSTSHPDRHLPARHQAGGQISAAVLRRVVAATCGRDAKIEGGNTM